MGSSIEKTLTTAEAAKLAELTPKAFLLVAERLGIAGHAKNDRWSAMDVEALRLSGIWTITWLERAGATGAPRDAAIEICGYDIECRIGATSTGTLRLDPKRKRSRIDIKLTSVPNMGRTIEGIYVLGNELCLCLARVGGSRPTRLVSTLADGQTLIIAKRA